MNIETNYQKFRSHLKREGLLYAFWRGIKYFIFLLRKQRDKFKQSPKDTITEGKLKIVCSNCGIMLFWNGVEVTKGAGLNVAINTLGLWTDSAKADWQILEKGKDYFKVRVVFGYLPLSQIWRIKIKDEHRIDWRIDVDTEVPLYIDEFRIVCLVSPRYKTWISNYQHADFPRFGRNFQDLYLDDQPVSLVGARFPIGDEFLPSFILEIQEKDYSSLIQNPPLNIGAHIIGFRQTGSEEKRDYSPGHYRLFTGRIDLFEKVF